MGAGQLRARTLLPVEAPTFDPMSSPRIVPYSSEQYDACRSLWVELTEHHRLIYGAPGIGGDDPGGDWDRHLASPLRLGTWVAVIDGVVVGLVGLQRTDRGGVEVEPMVVAAKHRGSGVGRALLGRVLDECHRIGESSVSVRPVARNTAALAAFKAMGFTTVGMVELFMDLDRRQGGWIEGVTIDGVDLDR